MAGRLSGKVAVVTGGSTGFGRGIAVALAREGANVVNADLKKAVTAGNYDESPELSTVDFVRSLGVQSLFQKTDVTKSSDVKALIEKTVETFGRLDILVNNAGVYPGNKPFHEFTERELDLAYSVIVKGTWHCSQAAIQAFLAQGAGGSIINIVSTAGLKGHAMQSPYNMAKAAQANLTRCMAIEYASQQIRVNGICPTYCKTSMSRVAVENPEFDQIVRQTIPLGRWGEISDVANASVFLASDEGRFVHGHLLPVDGGEML